MDILNAKMAVHGFSFRLKGATRRIVNPDWSTSVVQRFEWIPKLREGEYKTLNVFTVMRPLSYDGLPIGGDATYPEPPEGQAAALPIDGVRLDQKMLNPIKQQKYSVENALVHEVGHWLNLLHTFEFGCSEFGDWIEDTNWEAEASETCDFSKNTCPDRPANQTVGDPVNNLMDYAIYDKSCGKPFEFTDGQRYVQGNKVSSSW